MEEPQKSLEEQAIGAIKRLGGKVVRFTEEGQPGVGVSVVGGDAALGYLPAIPRLKFVFVQPKGVSDKGLAHLSKISTLEDLSLKGTPITDAGLAHLAPLKLRSLGLDETRVAGPGLKHLRNMPDLEFLDLSMTPVTDEGLAHLHGLKSLTRIDLDNTRVTDAGVSALQKALPRLNIER